MIPATTPDVAAVAEALGSQAPVGGPPLGGGVPTPSEADYRAGCRE